MTLTEPRMSDKLANYYATCAADRERRPYSLYPSRRLVEPFYTRLNPAAYTGTSLGGRTQ